MGIVDQWSAWGGAEIFQSTQKIDIASPAGTYDGANPRWQSIWNQSIAEVDPAYSFAWARKNEIGNLNSEFHELRCHLTSGTNVRFFRGPYDNFLGPSNNIDRDISLWVYEFNPSVIESLQVVFWNANNGRHTFATPLIDLSKVMFFHNQAWFNSPGFATEGNWGFWELTNTYFRPAVESTSGGIPHMTIPVVEFK